MSNMLSCGRANQQGLAFLAERGNRFQQASRCAVRAFKPEKPTLLDKPLSPFGARVRYVIYSGGLESTVDIQSPDVMGGPKSEEYMKLHPAGKFPLLVLPDGQGIPESAVISEYILEKYGGWEKLMADTPERRAAVRTIVHIIDVYFAPVMGCMYKPMEAGPRAAQLAELTRILNDLEARCEGPMLAGASTTAADVAAFPLFVFMTFMLPQFFGWSSVFEGRPKLEAWWNNICADPVAARVMEEIRSALEGWKAGGRWDACGVNEQVRAGEYVWAGADVGKALVAK